MPQFRFSMKMEANLARTLSLFFVVFPAQIFGIDSFCNATSVSVGETASILCHFSEDLSKSPGLSNVNVYLYKAENGSDFEPVFYYHCVNGITRINGSEGYTNKNNLTDHLEILIHNATKKHAGLYKCIALASKKRASTCTLQINEDLHSSSDSTINGNADKGDDANETEKGANIIVPATIIPIVFVLGVIIVIVILCMKRKKRQRGGRLPLQNNVQIGQLARSHDDLRNNAGVPQNTSVNGQGTPAVGESSSVLLPVESHLSSDDHTHNNSETISFTKEQMD